MLIKEDLKALAEVVEQAIRELRYERSPTADPLQRGWNRLLAREEARGEVVKACPACLTHYEWWRVAPSVCDECQTDIKEWVYFQRVPPPEERHD